MEFDEQWLQYRIKVPPGLRRALAIDTNCSNQILAHAIAHEMSLPTHSLGPAAGRIFIGMSIPLEQLLSEPADDFIEGHAQAVLGHAVDPLDLCTARDAMMEAGFGTNSLPPATIETLDEKVKAALTHALVPRTQRMLRRWADSGKFAAA